MQSIPSNFWGWAATLTSDERCWLLGMVLVFSLIAIGIVCGTVFHIQRSRAEDALKRELLDRGMSADEIATVINARPSKNGPSKTSRL